MPPSICLSCFDDDCPIAVCCAEEHLICVDCINGLVRAQIGDWTLNGLAPGEWRDIKG